MQTSAIASGIKKLLVSSGAGNRTIPFGVYRGLKLNIDLASQAQIFFGLWERETYSAIRSAVSEASWLIDVGAGRGELCLYYLSKKPAGFAVAIEPNESERDRLDENVALNEHIPRTRLRVLGAFAGSTPSAGCVTLDQIDVDHDQCGFVKIDVDGHEVEVLAGAPRLLSGRRRRLLVETHSRELEREVVGILERHGFDVRVIDNAWWRLVVPEQRPIDHNRWVYAVSPAL
jgi:precorrin-6B methylase 2